MRFVLLCACALLSSTDLSEDEKTRVADFRRKSIVATAAEIAGIEKQAKAAQQSRDKPKVEELKSKITALRKRINELKQAKDEELFSAMRDEEQQAQAAAFREQQTHQRLREIAEAGPVSITRMGIVTNVIGLPELVVEVQNNTNDVIDAFEFEADCFNKFGEPVNEPGGGNRFRGQYSHSLKPRSKEVVRAQMSLRGTTANADIWICRAKLASGEVWTQTKDEASKVPYGLAKAKLSD